MDLIIHVLYFRGLFVQCGRFLVGQNVHLFKMTGASCQRQNVSVHAFQGFYLIADNLSIYSEELIFSVKKDNLSLVSAWTKCPSGQNDWCFTPEDKLVLFQVPGCSYDGQSVHLGHSILSGFRSVSTYPTPRTSLYLRTQLIWDTKAVFPVAPKLSEGYMAENRKPRRPGRPRGRQFNQDVHVRLSEELRTRLASLKAQNDMSFSEIVREALEARLCLAEQSGLIAALPVNLN